MKNEQITGYSETYIYNRVADKPIPFNHTGTEMAQGYVQGSYNGAPKCETNELILMVSESYYDRVYNGNYGVQNRELVRNANGWPLTRAGSEQLDFGL